MKFIKLFVFTLLLGLFSSQFTQALLVKTLSVTQLVELSERIFRGTVSDITTEDDPYESGQIVKYFTFRVDECLKGTCGETITIKQISGIKGVPEYETGEAYLLFMPEDSEDTGLSAPVGLWQGRFLLEQRQGRLVVPALSKNVRLLGELRNEAQTRSLGLPQLNYSDSSVDYSAFKAVITNIVKGAHE